MGRTGCQGFGAKQGKLLRASTCGIIHSPHALVSSSRSALSGVCRELDTLSFAEKTSILPWSEGETVTWLYGAEEVPL